MSKCWFFWQFRELRILLSPSTDVQLVDLSRCCLHDVSRLQVLSTWRQSSPGVVYMTSDVRDVSRLQVLSIRRQTSGKLRCRQIATKHSSTQLKWSVDCLHCILDGVHMHKLQLRQYWRGGRYFVQNISRYSVISYSFNFLNLVVIFSAWHVD